MAAEDLAATAALERLVYSWNGVPAFAYDRHLDVLVANRAARSILGLHIGTNVARFVYLDGAVDLAAEPSRSLRDVVTGALCASLDRHGEDERFATLVGELIAVSEPFADDWARWPAPVYSGRVACVAMGGTLLDFAVLTSPALGDATVSVITRLSDPLQR